MATFVPFNINDKGGTSRPAKIAGIFCAYRSTVIYGCLTPCGALMRPQPLSGVERREVDSRFSVFNAKNRSTMADIVLTKSSGEEQIRSYFGAILELSRTDNEFPVNLDDVWGLVYSEK